MKKWAGVFIGLLLFPFVLFAQETSDDDEAMEMENPVAVEETEDTVAVEETENPVAVEETEVDTIPTARAEMEIPNQVGAIRTAQPGDYIVLPSGNRYVLTSEEIMIMRGTFGYENLSDVATAVRADGTVIRTVSQAHEIQIYPDGKVVHVLKTNAAYAYSLRYIEENYHIMRYLDNSGVLRDSKPLDRPSFNVFRVFIQFETISNGSEELSSLAVSVYNNEGKNFVTKYCSAPNMVWGMVSSERLFRTALPVIRPISELAVSTAALPSSALREIANRTIKIGETVSLLDLTNGRNVTSWTSSTPSAARVDASGNVSGVSIGNAFITINDTEYISIAVVPQVSFYVVPESQSVLLPQESRASSSDTRHFNEYRTEPTFRLSWRYNNKGENKGASGSNGGIDILGRGANYQWLWTTYYQGGWFYSLNGVMREMIDGYQKSANGVELTVRPEFVYEDGVPYLQLRHFLKNTSNVAVTGQKFGASADVMIHNNDDASLVYTSYGAHMTDSQTNPSLELMFICLSGNGITPVDTLWLGTYSGGRHLNYIHSDRRDDVHNADSALGFSYQNINLAPGETKEFIVRFTLARTKN